MNNQKECPFNKDKCDENCALYITPKELNETVKNKLSSIGIIERETGICSLKNMALCFSRYIFENTVTNYKR